MADRVKISDVRHTVICGGRNLFCGHPWIFGVHNFGGGEIVITHFHAPCAYREPRDVRHDFGYMSRSRVILQRTLNGGETWPKEFNVVLYDHTVPIEEQRKWLFQPNPKYAKIDMSKPDSTLITLRAYAGKPYIHQATGNVIRELVIFALRSADRGRTWEKTPIIIKSTTMAEMADTGSYLKMPDGSILHTFIGLTKRIAEDPLEHAIICCSDNGGLTWHYLSTISRDPFGEVHMGYPVLLALPDGRILSTLGMMTFKGGIRWVGVSFSNDEGLTWTQPKRITRWGTSPYPVLLRDDRILILYAWRRTPPYGIRGRVSDDGGETWSQEFIVRGDGAGPDLGYPVVTQLEDGRIFTAYYSNIYDGVAKERNLGVDAAL